MLDQREQDFEGRFAHDQELRYRIAARRNRLVGEWAGSQLGKAGEALVAYAQSLVSVEFLGPADGALARKIRADFDAAGIDISDHRIERHISECLAMAEKQIMEG